MANTATIEQASTGASEQRPISIEQINYAAVEPVILGLYDKMERLRLISQPQARIISPEQLICEVKAIYAGLIMVEAKCCEVDANQHQAALGTDNTQPTLNNEQWQALIALHRTLLHEHHDFFLASQHPSASPSLKSLPHKYAMPGRMWRHGIQSFLELLRHRLPHSLEHMITFIYLAYSMMALLYETVSAFEDIWIECLGDLAHYRSVIEDYGTPDEAHWKSVAIHWYSKAVDKTPYDGRLYHHLAILARPSIQQLFYYCKSLVVRNPFASARESILTLFDPIFNRDVFVARSQFVDSLFIQLHSIIFTYIEFEKFDVAIDSFLDILEKRICRPRLNWKVHGFYMAACNITALFQYGARDSLLRKAWKEGYQKISLNASKRLAFTTLSLTLRMVDNNNMMPHYHAWMVFLAHTINFVPVMRLIENQFPWKLLIEMLNVLRTNYDKNGDDDNKITSNAFPVPDKGIGRPLPEDYELRGFVWAKRYFPARWFEDSQIDNEERTQELPSMTNIRKERILWLAMRVCAADDWIKYDSELKIFYMHPALKNRIDEELEREAAVAVAKQSSEDVEKGGYGNFEEEDYFVEQNSEDEMTGYSNSEEEDYLMVVPENVKKLKEKKRELKAQLQAASPVVTPETIAEVSRSALVKGPEVLHQEYTALVVDLNLLISYLETFIIVSSKGWTVIIPNSVITELHDRANNSDSVGDSARSALYAIKQAIAGRKNIRIITANNSDVTKAGFFREMLERDEDDEARDIDDIIICMTRQQSESRRQEFAEIGFNGAELAILLTEDTNMRVKANARGVPTISIIALKRYLVQLEGRSKTTRPKRKPAIAVEVKSEEDEIDTPMFDSAIQTNDAVESKPKIHLGKQAIHFVCTEVNC
ncbi:hypothetical protein BDD12DRAFT_785789 [Trichophaea hybrida]|nr:hypothetical protein BDD12DRAFT_785789 [Trichophaea hybrida]